MASDTAPASTTTSETGPGTAPETSGPFGWLASAIAPVEPARPDFDLPPVNGTTPAPEGTTDDKTGASSTHYRDLDTTNTNTSKGDGRSSTQQQSVVRAWLLAGAERWRKGADARNKALDVRKAKAQAHKTTTTVNRTEKTASTAAASPSGGNSDGGKSLGSKGGGGNTSSSGNGGRSPKSHTSNHSNGSRGGGGRPGPSGSSGSSGAGGKGTSGGHGGAGTSGGKSNSAPKNPGKTRNGSDGSTWTSGGGREKNNSSNSGSTPSHSNGSGNETGGRGDRKKNRQPETTTTCGDGAGIDKQRKPKKTTDTPSTQPSTSTKSSNTTKTDAGQQDPKAKNEPAKDKQDNAPAAAPKKSGTSNTDTTSKPGTGSGTGKPINLQSSREAGYRDGTRIATVQAHAEAYRDGVKDGYRDRKEDAGKAKARLDKAHTDFKNRPAPDPTQAPVNVPPKPAFPPKPAQPPTGPAPKVDLVNKPKATGPAVPPTAPAGQMKKPPTPKTGTSPNTHTANTAKNTPSTTAAPNPTTAQEQPVTTSPQQATPIKVNHIDSKGLHLGDGAARAYIPRGEVRTLKQFDRELWIKAATLHRIAEYTKTVAAEEYQEASAIATLLEQAKAVRGGEKVAAALTRLQEKSAAQAQEATTLKHQAARSADRTNGLLANVNTRYGGLYKAVVDSPETVPAERNFYND